MDIASLGLPLELLKYSPEQLSLALTVVISGEVQALAKEVEQADTLVQQGKDQSGDGVPFPRLSREFDAEVRAVLMDCSQVALEGNRLQRSSRDLRNRAAEVRAEYERFTREAQAVLATIKRSPRG